MTVEVADHLGRQREAVLRLLASLDRVLTDEQRAAVAEELGWVRELQDMPVLAADPGGAAPGTWLDEPSDCVAADRARRPQMVP